MDDFDQGELGDLKKKYSSQLSMLKEMFPDWSDMDLLLGLQDTDGDLQTTIDRIAEGMLIFRHAVSLSVGAWRVLSVIYIHHK